MRFKPALMVALALMLLGAAPAPTVRPPAVAGTFYPGDAKELAATVDRFLNAVPRDASSGSLVALVAPHAGYPFSGPVAAYSFAQLKGRNITRVVVIAPSHYEAFPFVSAYGGDVYRTPLGDIPVDKEFVKKLAKATPVVQISGRGHEPNRRGGEHALEVELPFLQRVLGKFQLVPLVMGEQDLEQERALGLALAKLISGPETIILASSDLSHYHSQQEAARMDGKMLAALEHWDHPSLAANFRTGAWEACGGGPILAAMLAAQKLGADQVRVLKYATSGDAGAGKDRVVGYAAIAFTRSETSSTPETYNLTPQERSELLGIAKQAVRMAVTEGKRYEPPPPKSQALLEPRGAFVTLKRHGDLRGCIGHILAQEPLYLTVREVAIYAATRDPRFPAVSAKELSELEFEISVLSPLRKIKDAHEVRVGEHGLLIRSGARQGLLLPQVPVEQKWDRRTFLEETCHKAGLDANAWKQPDSELFVFTALVFDDSGGRSSKK